MSYDGLMLAAVVAELNRAALPARVNKIYQPTETELVFHLHAPGRNQKLIVSCHPRYARMHLTSATHKNPPVPPNFCALLRKHLEGSRLTAAEQPGLERLCRLHFASTNDLGMPRELSLACEVMGRFSNVVFLERAPAGTDGGKETWRILDAIRRSSPGDNPTRPVLPGLRYFPPPAGGKIDPVLEGARAAIDLARRLENARAAGHSASETNRSAAWQFLQSNIEGVGALSAREALHRSGLDPDRPISELTPDRLTTALEVIRSWPHGQETPCLAESAQEIAAFAPFSLNHLVRPASSGLRLIPFSGPSQLLDRVYELIESEEKTSNLRSRLYKAVRSELSRTRKKLSLQEEELQAAARAKEYKIKGDLILANLPLVAEVLLGTPPGSGEIMAALPNWYDHEGGNLEVALDRRLSAPDQARAYFRRYQKAKKTSAQATVHRDRSLAELAYLKQVESSLASSSTLAELGEIQDELTSQGYVKTHSDRRGRKDTGRPGKSGTKGPLGQVTFPLRFTSSDGLTILVGKNNRQNDYLTMKLTSPGDVWLHTKDIPGSHVVIRLAPGQTEAPEPTLLEAAGLAAYFSQARDSSKVPVDYTRRSDVWKPSGSRPGMVLYKNQRTAFVTPDPGLVARLSQGERQTTG